MPKLPGRPFWEEDPVEYLVGQRYPQLRWRNIYGTGRNVRGREHISQDVRDKAEVFRQELFAKSEAEIAELVSKARQNEVSEAIRKSELEEEQRSFNQPSAFADFNYWAQNSYWTPDDCTALSLGRDPRKVSWKDVQPFVNISKFCSDLFRQT